MRAFAFSDLNTQLWPAGMILTMRRDFGAVCKFYCAGLDLHLNELATIVTVTGLLASKVLRNGRPPRITVGHLYGASSSLEDFDSAGIRKAHLRVARASSNPRRLPFGGSACEPNSTTTPCGFEPGSRTVTSGFEVPKLFHAPVGRNSMKRIWSRRLFLAHRCGTSLR